MKEGAEMNRRDFHKQTLMLGIGALAGSAKANTGRTSNPHGDFYEEPLLKKLPVRVSDVAAGGDGKGMRLAIKGVTYTGIWYDGPALTIPQIIGRAKKYGFAGVEIDAKRPQAFPLDVDEKARDEIRRKLDETGVELAAVSSYNNFIEPLHEYQEMNLLTVREQLKLARDLNAKILRVFGSWCMIATDKNGKGRMAKDWYTARIKDLSRDQRLELAIKALKELAPYAEEMGVTMALQNHPPGIQRYQDVLDILDAVNSPYTKACIDLQNLQAGEDARQAMLDTGSRQAHMHYGGEFRRAADGRLECYVMNKDFPTYIKAMLEIGYQGFLSFEFCHRCVQRDAQGNKLSNDLAGIERVDEQVQLARDFMNQTIADAKAALKAEGKADS